MTIGTFDGVHNGHREILRETRQLAQTSGLSSTVFSFEPTPVEFMLPDDPPARLTRFGERFRLFAGLGLDEFFCPPFKFLRSVPPDEFVESLLHQALQTRHLVIGHDFRFGAGRQGTIADLERASRRFGFSMDVISPVEYQGRRISSTVIRRALAEGDLEDARAMLGRHYSMSGRVIRGLGLGRELGFPTANVSLKRRKSPVDGIFAVRVGGIGSGLLNGVASVGTRPTVGGHEALLEVLIFDFDRNIYGKRIEVRFIRRLRAEVHFPGLEAMKAQIHRDVVQARAVLEA